MWYHHVKNHVKPVWKGGHLFTLSLFPCILHGDHTKHDGLLISRGEIYTFTWYYNLWLKPCEMCVCTHWQTSFTSYFTCMLSALQKIISEHAWSPCLAFFRTQLKLWLRLWLKPCEMCVCTHWQTSFTKIKFHMHGKLFIKTFQSMIVWPCIFQNLKHCNFHMTSHAVSERFCHSLFAITCKWNNNFTKLILDDEAKVFKTFILFRAADRSEK